MFARVKTVAVHGIEIKEIDVQVSLNNGLPQFNIVGLPSKAVAESKERVRAAINSLGLNVPSKRITVNLSPVDMPKEGNHYDLPIMLCLLSAMGLTGNLSDFISMGEISLDGLLMRVCGALPSAVFAKNSGLGLICPESNVDEVSQVLQKIISSNTINGLLDNIKTNQLTQINQITRICSAESQFNKCNIDAVYGQEKAKRAIVLAAAGRHNILMIGTPGTGKSMLARCLSKMLKPLTEQESLENMMIASVIPSTYFNMVDGQSFMELAMSKIRPFRDPHHSCTEVSLLGGGSKYARPGEITLAHNGILFLDEVSEFDRNVLEALRQPVETREIIISRSGFSVRYPCNFQLVAAMNPCKCGNFGIKKLECSYAPSCTAQYQSKISGPILDRFDIKVKTEPKVAIYSNNNKNDGMRLEMIIEKLRIAWEIQESSYKNLGIAYNAELKGEDLEKYCYLDEECKAVMSKATERLHLSYRSHNNVLRLALTIANLDGRYVIKKDDLLESISYRIV